ncbi:MAG: hypothetical protein JW828_01370 [Sedimentisphaerales bacterium]|nr:hypothetical protein [Sedimentisphaerales bacterium]
MQRIARTIGILSVLAVCPLARGQSELGAAFIGQDLHLNGNRLIMHQEPAPEGKHTLVYEEGFSMSIGSNELSSDRAVVWIDTSITEFRGRIKVHHEALIYLHGNVWAKRGATGMSSGMDTTIIDRGESLVVKLPVSGEIFTTALQRTETTSDQLEILPIVQQAMAAVSPIKSRPDIREAAKVPQFPQPPRPEYEPPQVAKPWRISDMVQPDEGTAPVPAPIHDQPRKKEFEYPINFADLWEPAPTVESTQLDDGSRITTIIGRFYLWQQRDEDGAMLEFQADNAVVFHGAKIEQDQQHAGRGMFSTGSVDAVYLQGNIVMTEGQRTVRADEIYYDFRENQALAVNAEMRNFDAKRGLPIYIRARQLRQVSETVFEAEDISLTTSEFYLPQISLTASRLVLTDTTNADARTRGGTGKSSYDGVLYDAGMRVGELQVFSWPKIRTNFERPDVPIRRVRVGDDSDMGFTIETRWYLARLLGKAEPPGVDSTLAVDYFSDRGPGAGVDIEYEGDDHYGDVIGYVMKDRGTDDLGRTADRRNVDPQEDVRGRFRFRHRQYLPHDWQLTVESSYASDKNFLEWMYRSEFNVGKEQETVVHLKRITDNWGFAFLTKWRINDFVTQTEELPTVEYHLKGASFWDHRLTYYSDSQISRFRDRLASDVVNPTWDESFYTFGSTRHEVDMPILWDTIKFVPYVATTYGYEDQEGFDRTLDGRIEPRGEKDLWLNEAGVRLSTMFWRSNQFIRSRFWDLNGIRHIVRPHVEAVAFDASDRAGDMRDMMNFGISQRWQTRRGEKDKLRSLDWMRLDVDATFMSQDGRPSDGPAKFLWNDPSIPMLVRRNASEYGILRDSVNADYQWRVSDTMTLLSDVSYDVRSGYCQQANIGIARYVFPDMSYYVGNRYLRPVVIDADRNGDGINDVHEEGSNALVTAITYRLNERYTATVSQEYNFDYGKSVRSDLTFLRRYHRLYYGLTFSLDQTRDRQSVSLSVWPEGVKELALGSRKYVGITGPLLEE